MRIIIADDEILERKALLKIMQTEMPHIEVVGEAANGRNAIQLADELLPDLMLMDIKMPGINGVEAVKAIKEKHHDIKFIMISAFDTFEYAKEVMQQGVKEYILKPGRNDDIIDAISRVQQEIEAERKLVREHQQLKEQLSKAIKLQKGELNRIESIHDSQNPLHATKKFIDEQYMKGITLEDAADHANLSPYHFSKIFKENYGVTFIDYLTDIRIEHAKREILQTNKSLKEICFSCGYKDPNYFSRVFKKKTGFSPTDFRIK